MTALAAGARRWRAGPVGWPWWALAASAGLHAAVLVALLVRVSGLVLAAGEQPVIEVVMVRQPAQAAGASIAAPATPVGAGPATSAVAGPAAGEQAPAARAAAPEAVRMGTGAADSDPLTVTGDEGIIPAASDSRFHNLPPGYPAEAARLRAQGVVGLAIRVSPAGVPVVVVVARSSGFDVLDDAARRAVALWRFRPALRNGQPVPFDYALNIRFTMGGQ